MGTANEQIRVSGWVNEILDRQRRDGESYNDVLERMFEEESDRDLLAGFGKWSNEDADRVREARKKRKNSRKSGCNNWRTTSEGRRRSTRKRT